MHGPRRHAIHAPPAAAPRGCGAFRHDAHGLPRRAFTLIEILIVVAILAILSSVVFTTFAGASEEARASAAQADLHRLQTQVMLSAQESGGAFPPVVTDAMLMSWFRNTLRSPWASGTTLDGVETDASGDASVNHPVDKTVTGALHAFWYNPANGIVRARVRDLGDPARTIDLYQFVNITSIGGLSDVE